MIGLTYLVGGLWFFALGTVVGSFVNVCVYRIPFQKSVIWPGSTCPKCLCPIAARDNVPIVGWLLLRGACRRCGLAISPRYPLVELLVGLLFVAVYATDVVFGAPSGILDTTDFYRLLYHLILVSCLVVATFIDYDFYIIPDEVTVTGMVLGLLLGTLLPEHPTGAGDSRHDARRPGRRPARLGGRRRPGLGGPDRCRPDLPPRGDGLRRRDLAGHDRLVPGLAGRHPDVLLRPLLRPGPRALETRSA